MKSHSIVACVLAALVLSATCGSAQEDTARPSGPVVVTGSSTTGSADNTPAAQFQSSSQLVLVPVVVTRGGAPLTGLKKDQFKIYENGKEQKISIFEEVKSDTSPVSVSRTRDRAQKTFSNMQVDQSSAKRLVIIVIDLINTRFEDRTYARQQLVKFLSENVDSGALISLVALGRGRVKVIHDFTSNPDTLIAALNHVRKKGEGDSALTSEVGVAESQVFESEVNDLTDFLENGQLTSSRPFGSALGSGGFYRWLGIRQTLDGMNLIAQAYAGVPGRKALIWATGGFPFQIDGSTMLLQPARMRDPSSADLSDILPYYEQTWQAMNNANFAIYPVDLRGLVTTNITAAERVNPRNLNTAIQRRTLVQMDTVGTFNSFADMTGGRAFYNSNDLAGSFKKATADSASYYMLAYYLDKAEHGKKEKKDWRKLKVKVDAPGVDVRARSGFFTGPAQQDFKDEVKLALHSPLDFTALPLTVRWLEQSPMVSAVKEGQAAQDGEQRKATFEIYVPANMIAIDSSDDNKMSVDIVASARMGTAQQVNGFAQTITGHLKPETLEKMRTSGFTYKGDIALPPGRYSVRFVVRDNVGERIGSVAAPIVVN